MKRGRFEKRTAKASFHAWWSGPDFRICVATFLESLSGSAYSSRRMRDISLVDMHRRAPHGVLLITSSIADFTSWAPRRGIAFRGGFKAGGR